MKSQLHFVGDTNGQIHDPLSIHIKVDFCYKYIIFFNISKTDFSSPFRTFESSVKNNRPAAQNYDEDIKNMMKNTPKLSKDFKVGSFLN